MTIYPFKSTTPFASIIDVSYFKCKENEVLFSIHTVFRIHDIEPMSRNTRLFQVDLTLTSDNDKDLTDRTGEETFPKSRGWYRSGSALLKISQPRRTQQTYKILLKETKRFHPPIR